jgi:putative ABC transport system ATP-binding protein
LGLEERLRDPVGLLSGGQRQALTLLMATLIRPQVLLLDEHTAALDPKTAQQVLALTVKLIADQQLTALMVTHNMRQALQLGNRLIMLHAGRVILDVAGAEKAALDVDDLLKKFYAVRGEEFVSDRMLLV